MYLGLRHQVSQIEVCTGTDNMDTAEHNPYEDVYVVLQKETSYVVVILEVHVDSKLASLECFQSSACDNVVVEGVAFRTGHKVICDPCNSLALGVPWVLCTS